MNIKEIFNWIKEKIEGNRIERLTEGKNEIVPEKKSMFKDKIKYDTKTKKVDIEKDYEKLLEEYNKKFEELENLTAEIVLNANDVDFDKSENLIQKIEEGKQKQKIVTLVKMGKVNTNDKASVYIAGKIAEEMWQNRIERYLNSSLSLYLQSKQKANNGQDYIVTEEEKYRIDLVDRWIKTAIDKEKSSAKIQGIQHAVAKNSLLDEATAEKINKMEEIAQIKEEYGEKLKAQSEVKAIEISDDKNKKMQTVLYYTDRLMEFLPGNLNIIYAKEFKETSNRYFEYINHGVQIKEPEMFREDVERFGKYNEYFCISEEDAIKELKDVRIDKTNER